jgi:hypothetical protein
LLIRIIALNVLGSALALINLAVVVKAMTANISGVGEGCLTESSKFAECLWQLLPNHCYLLGGLSALNLI